MTAGQHDVDELLAEQRDFYRADAQSFDRWLATMVDDGNDEPAARRYRAGRGLIADAFARSAPLGRVLEIAAGTGRLAQLYCPHAASAVLLDTSRESLGIAARRLADASPAVSFVEADIFDWDSACTFDTIVFSAWLHHVPHERFDAFWQKVESLLEVDGRVTFDFPDIHITPRDEPTSHASQQRSTASTPPSTASASATSSVNDGE